MRNGVVRLLRRTRGPALLLAAFLATSCASKPPYEGKSVDQLEEMLKSEDSARQVQGAYGLSRLGPEASPAVPTLIELLNSPNALVRQSAAAALGKIGPAAGSAVPALVRMLKDRDWLMRRHAAMALGDLGPTARAAVADLQALRGDRPTVREAAEQALARIDPETFAPKKD